MAEEESGYDTTHARHRRISVQDLSLQSRRNAPSNTPSTSDQHQASYHRSQESNDSSFNKSVLHTVETVGHSETAEFHVPKNLALLQQATEETVKGLELITTDYRPSTVWQDINFGLDQLNSTWTKIQEAANDLKFYIPMNKVSDKSTRNLSVESVGKEWVYLGDQGLCGEVLIGIIQEAYHAFEPNLRLVLNLISLAFKGEVKILQSSSLEAISTTTSAIQLLGLIKEVDQELRSVHCKAFSFLETDSFLSQRFESIEGIFEEFCGYVKVLQRSFFHPKHLQTKGQSSIEQVRDLSEIMRRCWKEGALLVKHLSRLYPELKPKAQVKYGQVLAQAGSLLALMQDSSDVQELLTESKTITNEKEEVRDLVQSQLWLLPCLQDLLSLCIWSTRRLQERQEVSLLRRFKTVMYDVVMVTIARASWLLSWRYASLLSELYSLKEQGSQTLLFVYNYNKSRLSLLCTEQSPIEDMSLYSALVCSTDARINAVLSAHRMIQTESSKGCSLEDSNGVNCDEKLEETNKFLSQEGEDWHQLHLKTPTLLSKGSKRVDLQNTQETQYNETELQGSGEQIIRNQSTFSDSLSVDLPTGFADLAAPENDEIQPAFSEEEEEEESPQQTQQNENQKITGYLSRDISRVDRIPPRRKTICSRAKNKLMTCCCCLDRIRTNSPESHNPSRKSYTSQSISPIPPTEHPFGLLEFPELSNGVQSVLVEDLTNGVLIGSGSGGSVWRMSYFERPVAVKIMNENGPQNRFKEISDLYRKISGHPNIVQFVGTCAQDQEQGSSQNPMMVMELCDLGDLFKILCNARWVCEKRSLGQDISEYKTSRGYLLYSSWALRLQVACDIAAGVEFMHSIGIVHRDLTSYNVVLTRGEGRHWIAKVCDFERSREVPDCGVVPRSDTFANSPAWAAPEILDNRDYSTQADVYSFGVILWELVTLKNPNELYIDSIRNNRDFSHNTQRNQMLSELAEFSDPNFHELSELTSLILFCLKEAPCDRPTLQELHNKLNRIYEQVHNLLD